MFDWSLFLEVAELCKIEDGKLSEAWLRTGISRAYYSSFNLCNDIVQRDYKEAYKDFRVEQRNKHGSNIKTGLHDLLIDFLKEKTSYRPLQQAATNLEHAKTLRIWADYKPDKHFASPSFAYDTCMEYVDEVRKFIDEFTDDDNHTNNDSPSNPMLIT